MMRLAIMQPYFFPYMGYFSLIKHTDKWIVFDTSQFIRHGWIERNRILKPQMGWQYIKIPLEKHKREIAINDVRIKNTENWRKKILAQLTHYKKVAPYYKNTIDIVNKVFELNTDSIVKLDVYALEVVCQYLNIAFNYSIFSEMNLKIGEVNEPDEWALEISKVLGAKSYYNPPSGQEFFNRNKYDRENIDLKFLTLNLHEYKQKRNEFEPGLSIIDVMMFNSPERMNEMLDNYAFTS